MAWRHWLIPAAVLLGCLVRPAPAVAAGPRLIVVEGDLLATPIRLTDWEENLQLVLATASASAWVEPGRDRPRLDLLYFYLPEGAPLTAADGAPPQARVPYWPAIRGHPAVIGGHVPDPLALEILARHGVPTFVDTPAPTAERWSVGPARAIALVVSGFVALWLSVVALRVFRTSEA